MIVYRYGCDAWLEARWNDASRPNGLRAGQAPLPGRVDRAAGRQSGVIEFKEDGVGEFHFGLVSGQIDYRETMREGEAAVEWSWDSNGEMDAVP